ncbi:MULTISPECIES: hypothetical protein [unclassified Methylophaga]|uniref:hypothetical protein n=1 Tax=unclassified Methylophaga TaxID=2629249 RepID=UPI000C9921E4|nr:MULTISPECIES: hypothetical protein [unclassified Methylophaga]MBN47326.1 hypothetical protein [Methylophaga sp.]|tara:strand:- start:129697 stop:130542 length:846 start_codon:yes stop_codon:yes gene_type:complete
MKSEVIKLTTQLTDLTKNNMGVIEWASPIPVFGDIEISKVATLGLNPSNREFIDASGEELTGSNRRFHTLQSLGVSDWRSLTKEHISLIEGSYRDYFKTNPYNGWFKRLDELLVGVDASYYGNKLFDACHLDLIPFATYEKWTHLTSKQKRVLLESSKAHLIETLKNTNIELLILNGRSVVNAFQVLTDEKISSREMASWSLPRTKGGNIKGYAYEAKVSKISGHRLNKEVNVIGFNHNIQSSFGVTKQVKKAIRDWISRYRHEVNNESRSETTKTKTTKL